MLAEAGLQPAQIASLWYTDVYQGHKPVKVLEVRARISRGRNGYKVVLPGCLQGTLRDLEQYLHGAWQVWIQRGLEHRARIWRCLPVFTDRPGVGGRPLTREHIGRIIRQAKHPLAGV